MSDANALSVTNVGQPRSEPNVVSVGYANHYGCRQSTDTDGLVPAIPTLIIRGIRDVGVVKGEGTTTALVSLSSQHGRVVF